MVWIADHTVTLVSNSSGAALQLYPKLCDLSNTFPIDSFYFLKLSQLLCEVKNSVWREQQFQNFSEFHSQENYCPSKLESSTSPPLTWDKASQTISLSFPMAWWEVYGSVWKPLELTNDCDTPVPRVLEECEMPAHLGTAPISTQSPSITGSSPLHLDLWKRKPAKWISFSDKLHFKVNRNSQMVWKLFPNWKSIFRLSLYDSVFWVPGIQQEEVRKWMVWSKHPWGWGLFFCSLRYHINRGYSFNMSILFFSFLLHEALP